MRVTSDVNASSKKCESFALLTLRYLFPLVVSPDSRYAQCPKHHRLSVCCLGFERRSVVLLVEVLPSGSSRSWLVSLHGLMCDRSGFGYLGTTDYVRWRACYLRHWAGGDWRWFEERVMAVDQALVRGRCTVCHR